MKISTEKMKFIFNKILKREEKESVQKDKPLLIDNALSSGKFPPEAKDVINKLKEVIDKNTSNRTVDEKQIDVDCSAFIISLTLTGYEPIQILALISKMYGSLMSSAPSSIGVNDKGEDLTPDRIQEMFFKSCIQERAYYEEFREKIKNVISGGTGVNKDIQPIYNKLNQDNVVSIDKKKLH